MPEHIRELLRAVHFYAAHERRFPLVLFRYEERSLPFLLGERRKRQYASHRPERPVERELADEKVWFRIEANRLQRKKIRECYRQVEHRSFFLEVGGRERNDDGFHLALGRLETRGPDGRS